jgi:hypothetical protein
MIPKSPFEHIYAILDSRLLGNPTGFRPDDSYIVTAQRIHALLEHVGMLRHRRNQHAEYGKEDFDG